MSKKRVRMLCVLLSAVFVFAAGCAKTEPQEKTTAESALQKTQIGITFDTFVLERWLKDRDVFVATAQKMGAEVNVQNANGDVEKQKEQINRFVQDKVDVIVVIPVDCYELGEEVENARNHGIEVISYDRMIQNAKTDLYITVDSEKVGEEMGRIMVEKLPEGGNVVMICGPEMDTNCMWLAHGFETAIADSNLKVVYKTHVEAWTSEYGTQAMREALSQTDQIDGLMCGNDGLAGFAIQVLSEQQLAGKVVVTGQDADLEACQRIVEGTQAMTGFKPIGELARMAAEFAVQLADKGTIKSVKDTRDNQVAEIPYYGLDPIAVTRENMDEVIVDSGFHLRDEVYLNVE
ncbi:sugar ABC transporter substrate-binding protein [Hespellia stercorisuis]|uniref:D-xylose transport system substrate-binding protein n=1 Tax=Hespellia stercorisuis DSM 15480 TaxID=1121950 RepID=A0A1M6M666_9FIRM|nr:substrate-binding domain-containing protein [Hespellia stercorisuis]SHJ78917.1 D-xylose transport system substrate-binding protein [Hespellia stercorisuis DSM 15480]